MAGGHSRLGGRFLSTLVARTDAWSRHIHQIDDPGLSGERERHGLNQLFCVECFHDSMQFDVLFGALQTQVPHAAPQPFPNRHLDHFHVETMHVASGTGKATHAVREGPQTPH
jgi:hypothetical protein